MEFKLKALLFLAVIAVGRSAELRCDYKYFDFILPFYECDGKITTGRTDSEVTTVTGSHTQGKGNDDINAVIIRDCSMETIPRKLRTWFKNFKHFGIVNVQNCPNFQRTDFTEFTFLTHFYARQLPNVRELPRDTFWDMTDLEVLMLERMPNLENLHTDLLIHARFLRTFSVKGSTGITQITQGFFRNQKNTLTEVNFEGTNLARVGFRVFDNMKILSFANFIHAGCLDKMYRVREDFTLVTDIRQRCQDVIGRDNEITKNKQLSSSSSSE